MTPTRPADRPAPEATTPAAPVRTDKPARLLSLDAYRGFIMLLMASSGFALTKVAEHFPHNSVWRFLAFHTDHVAWVGCSLWDLIQPSFIFMVGVAIPYSHASRKAKGESEGRIFVHTVWRAAVLVFLGVFLTSNWSKRTNFVFTNVLAQIGLGYVYVYLLRGRGLTAQLSALALLLVGTTLWFAVYPLPGPGFDYAAVGLPANWRWLDGHFAHWDKNTNFAAAFDSWFLNLFPQQDPTKPFRFNPGGYATLNFVPSMATMILGLMAGEMLRRPGTVKDKLDTLIFWGSVCMVLGLLAGWFVCPIVKRIWTPSWVLYSGGWTFWLLAAFFWLIEVRGYRRWAFPLVVVGMNSIAMYLMSQLLRGWLKTTFHIHFGPRWFIGTYGPLVETSAILLVLWLICLWLYRRGIFLRV
jgi:predicted acyltransferase